ncbi:B-cell receptor CD22-like isoform X1 [Sphaeramia orbicularis]|uniref:B-cell receptor CD22-like isoform X1 n=2 Tax=Sphaeramia orbicularis TaxID=375764 RepID=UPI0011815F3C|nr:B-cell receptor CD22-like isoform X1 [Sphaeramia orbicularis]
MNINVKNRKETKPFNSLTFSSVTTEERHLDKKTPVQSESDSEMRTARMMSLTSASGFIVFLLSFTVVQGQNGWGVTYTSTQICALKGSTVDMSCTYTYPPQIKKKKTKVEKTFWFINRDIKPVDLKTKSEYKGRVDYPSKKNGCLVRISDLRQSDSAQYQFRFITNQPGGHYTGSPGVTLTVTARPDLQVHVSRSSTCRNSNCVQVELRCHSNCRLPDNYKYTWFKNGQKIRSGTSSSYSTSFSSGDTISCAVKGYEMFSSPPAFAPTVPSVSFSPSGEIIEGSSVTLTCTSDANPPVTKYTWYKRGNNQPQSRGEGQQFVLSFINSSDSGSYSCVAENSLGLKMSEYVHIDVKYPPRLPSVSMSPSGQIVEGSSVTLTCTSDANPPVTKYTWYKRGNNQLQSRGEGQQFVLSSINSSESGSYSCVAENSLGLKMSEYVYIDVKYPPRLPSVSVSPSGQIVQGSSVTLTCTSDANPPVTKYTWYKEDEDSPKASGQNFTITDFRSEHSGNYYCEAQNSRGRQNSASHLIVVSSKWKSVAAGVTVAVVLPIILISVFLLVRRMRALKTSSEPEDRADNSQQCPPNHRHPEEQDNLHYANVNFSQKKEDPVYSNTGPARCPRHKKEPTFPEYSVLTFHNNSKEQRDRVEETAEDSAVLYSTVNKTKGPRTSAPK